MQQVLRRNRMFVVLTAMAIGLAAALVWSSTRPGERTFTGVPVADPGPIHVHALGTDPADGSLYIATHTGLWRLDRDDTAAHRVTDRRQDTMGFTVTPSGRFLGSGHPDLRESRVPRLGLIESRDRGRTWRSVSLRGKADFHVLRVAGDVVYGFDAGTERLRVSRDGGRTWLAHKPPQPLLDLVVDPQNSQALVASSESQLYESRDAGATWRRLEGDPGYLAWPAASSLFRLGLRGDLWRASAPRSAWSFVSVLDGEPAAFLATSPRELFAALHDGAIEQTRDGGSSWTVRATP